MNSRSFHSLFMVASCAGAVLGCYLVSLRVASERAALEGVETRIVLEQRDLRTLQTEIGTRGRLAQLERWNVKVLALSAPAADQFLAGGFELAKLTEPQRKVDFEAPVVLAEAPATKPRQPAIGQPEMDDAGAPIAAPAALLRQASLKTETREVPVKPVIAMPQQAGIKSMEPPVTAAKPVDKKSVDKPGLAAAKPVTKPVRIATADPLAPIMDKRSAKAIKDPTTAR